MATITRFIGYFEDGAVQAGYDYDDAAAIPRITRVFAENNGPNTMRLTLKRKSDGATLRQVDCEPGFGREATLNNTQAQRSRLNIDNPLKPRLLDHDIEVQYPYFGD
jgi:hypothetical protein